jgi:demethylmenaquinone methyltransferase/2-methoxy-6-polyprenyl-1,4-benzoquinol methylase/phosphoethanolamine N-methyltransferase
MAAPPGAAPHTEGRPVRWARLYDLATSLLSLGRLAALHRRVVALAGIAPGERVLDVGCGPGRLAILAARAASPGGEAWGIDPVPGMIALARRKAARAGVRTRFDVGVIEALPCGDAQVDVVLCSMVLHHLPDDLKRRGLGEIHRVLRPGGRVVAVDFGATPGEGLGHVLCVLRLRRGWDHVVRLGEMHWAAGFEAVETGPTGHLGIGFVRAWKPAGAAARGHGAAAAG